MGDTRMRDMLFERMRWYEEHLRECTASGERPSALMFYGKVTGMAEAMEAFGLISAETHGEIVKRAWDAYMGRDV